MKKGNITTEDMFTEYLINLSGADNNQELQQWLIDQGQAQMKKHYKDFVQLMQQGSKTQIMENGAKLNYIKQLKGICPEGYEVAYFEEGGSITKKCKKCEKGAIPYRPISAQNGGTAVVKDFKNDFEKKRQEKYKADSIQNVKDVKEYRANGYKFKDDAQRKRMQEYNKKNPTELEAHKCGGKKKLAKKRK